jgi:hypothetical protein
MSHQISQREYDAQNRWADTQARVYGKWLDETAQLERLMAKYPEEAKRFLRAHRVKRRTPPNLHRAGRCGS